MIRKKSGSGKIFTINTMAAVTLVTALMMPLCAPAATLHYWQFENQPGYLGDSVGSAVLTDGGSTQIPLPRSGPGALFAGLPGNTAAADVSTNGLWATLGDAPTGSFTIEVFTHAYGLTGNSVLAGTVTGSFNSNVGWILQERSGLKLLFCNGASCTFVDPGITLSPGIDYYVAAAFDLAGGNAVFYARDLASDAPMTVITVPHSITAYNPITLFAMGRTFGFDGVLDEVRLSSGVVAEADLLIADWAAPVPVPAAGLLLGPLLVGWLALGTRRNH